MTPTSANEVVETLVTAAHDGRLDGICARHEVRLLGVFGSAATQEPEVEAHDVDVAVSFVGRGDLLRLLDELTVLTGFDRLDLAVIDGANPVLRAEALVGIPLFEAERGLYANEQMAALGERRDTEWLRRLDLEALQQ